MKKVTRVEYENATGESVDPSAAYVWTFETGQGYDGHIEQYRDGSFSLIIGNQEWTAEPAEEPPVEMVELVREWVSQ